MLPNNFWSKVDKTDSCWNWIAGKNQKGYGTFETEKTQMAHRISYEDVKGDIPKGLVIDHLCRNRACVNPEHLEVVSNLENIQRGLTGKINHHNSKKTHCLKGHEFTKENTYLSSKGSRECRACHRIRERQRKQMIKII